MRNRLLYLVTQPGMIILLAIIPVLILFINIGLHLLEIELPPISLTSPPDLALVTFVEPTSIQPGEDIGNQIHLVIQNKGDREAKDVIVDLYFGQAGDSDRLLEGGRVNVAIPVIAPGQQVPIPLAGVRLPSGQSESIPYLK